MFNEEYMNYVYSRKGVELKTEMVVICLIKIKTNDTIYYSWSIGKRNWPTPISFENIWFGIDTTKGRRTTRCKSHKLYRLCTYGGDVSTTGSLHHE